MTDPSYGREYALAAYALIFAALFGYLGWIHLAQRRLARRLEALERELAARARRAG